MNVRNHTKLRSDHDLRQPKESARYLTTLLLRNRYNKELYSDYNRLLLYILIYGSTHLSLVDRELSLVDIGSTHFLIK